MIFTLTTLLVFVCISPPCIAIPASKIQRLEPRAASDACAQASQAAEEFKTAHPDAILPHIGADIAYSCLISVPIYTTPALDLVNSLRAWIEFQSDLDILRDVPPGYLYESIDIRKELDKVYDRVKSGQYYSEYDFQVDVSSLLIRGRDGHLGFLGELQSIFQFRRTFGLVSISRDGEAVPEVYVFEDMYELSPTAISLKDDRRVSAVKSINGVEVNAFLTAESFTIPSQDPDSAWNALFDNLFTLSLDRGGNFRSPVWYPGNETRIEFMDGSTYTYPNTALVEKDLAGISTGEDLYQKFCTHSEDSEPSEASEETPLVELIYYPLHETVDSSGLLSGYFLDSPYDDTAVLSINSFEPGNGSESYLLSFQEVVGEFLALATQESKTNLIVDLQQNGGGSLDLTIDTCAQFFPEDPPNAKHNMRTSLGMEIIMKTAAALVATDSALDPSSLDLAEISIDAETRPFAWQNVITPDAVNFKSFEDYYGPHRIAGTEYTTFFQDNYTNADASEAGYGGLVTTGTNDRIGFPQYFDSKNIIMLHDGYCGSACTIFSEYMKNHGRVQSIAIGGRPQMGPMQGIGSTKGSQVFDDYALQEILVLRAKAGELVVSDYSEFKDTAFENWNSLAMNRSQGSLRLNGRNQYRIDDKSQTPLQFVYEASDCRIWFTPEMLVDVTTIWDRVAEIAFHSRKDGVFNSEYCVKDSTGHPTSIGGGLKKGEIGNQTPPANAKPSVKGWLINGTTISEQGPARYASPGNGQNVIQGAPLDKEALTSFVDGCKTYEGDAWFYKLMCQAVINSGKLL